MIRFIAVFVFGMQSLISMSQEKVNEFKTIFDGKSLAGWEADTAYWYVQNGLMVGEIRPGKTIKTNSFIIWKGGQPEDFELVLECRITAMGNSGINYRSERMDDIPFALKGYQADIDGKNSYTGQNYEERGRTTLAYRFQSTIIHPSNISGISENIVNNAWTSLAVMKELPGAELKKAEVNDQGWTKIHIKAWGPHLEHYVNGILVSEVIDNDTNNRKMGGWLGFQVHVGPPMKVEFRNIQLKTM